MGASQRNKGRRGEREFLNALGKLLGRQLERNLQQSDRGGADCLCVAGWAIEIKRVESSSLPSWWAQAETQANRISARPALAWRRNRQPWRVWLAKPGKDAQPITIEEFAELILKNETVASTQKQ